MIEQGDLIAPTIPSGLCVSSVARHAECVIMPDFVPITVAWDFTEGNFKNAAVPLVCGTDNAGVA